MSDIFIPPTAAASCCGGNEWAIQPQQQQQHQHHQQQHHPNSVMSDKGSINLAKEMSELSMKERENVLNDIHGVSEAIEESPEFLDKAFEQFDTASAKLPRSIRKAFDRAMFLRPALKQDWKWKLLFLRSEGFHADRAARRMANHYTEKSKLFGEHKLVKTIGLEDVGEQTRQILKGGCFVRLPQTDPTGRPIFFVHFSKFDFSDQDSMARASWYHGMTAYGDEDSQRKGFVNIAYCPGSALGQPSTWSKYAEHFRRVGNILPTIPFRITSYHFCHDLGGLNFILSSIQKNFGKAIRLRMTSHHVSTGSPIELEYALLAYGIPGVGPFFRDVAACQELAEKTFSRMEAIETQENEALVQEEANSGVFRYPAPDDALIGRGHPFHDYPGTRRLIQVIESELERYTSCDDKFSKTCIAMEIVKRFQEQHGRFLRQVPDGWVVLDDNAARAKVINIFRYKKNFQETTAATTSTTSSSSPETRNPKRKKLF